MQKLSLIACSLIACSLALTISQLTGEEMRYVETARLTSNFATQAAAADDRFVYAVSSTTVAKYDRSTGAEISRTDGKATHLNSALLADGKIYCAHSNFPAKPEKGEIHVIDPETMKSEVFHRFASPPGSVTWALKKGPDWWCHFAHYGKNNDRSVLVRYDRDWKETGRWNYPVALVKEWDARSLSGGIWRGDVLLVTGHDKNRLYRLKVSAEGKTIELIDFLETPFPGQGIAPDPKTGGLVGIDRSKKSVIFAEVPQPKPND